MYRPTFFEKLIGYQLNGIPILRKILIIFIGCVVVPAILQNAFYITETEANIQSEISDRMYSTLQNKVSKIETSLMDIVTLSIRYNNDNALYSVMDYNYESDLEYLIAYHEKVQKLIERDLPLNLHIDAIHLYCDNPTIFNGGVLRNDMDFTTGVAGYNTEALNRTPIQERGQPLEFAVSMNFSGSDQKYDRHITVNRKLEHYPEFRKYNKSVQFELNSAYYNSLLADVGLFDNLILADKQNRILFSGHSFKQTGDFDMFVQEETEDTRTVLKMDIQGFPLTLYGYYDANLISGEFSKSRVSMLLISTIGLVLSGILISIIGNNIVKRSKLIVSYADQIAQGNFTDVVFEDNGKDELAQIEHSIFDMSKQLQNYIEKEYTAKLLQSKLERETTQAKLLALQGQVNPHFLFNALESIRLNALDSPPEETSRMIKNMSKMFRHLVDWDEDIVLLKDDMKFLNEFLTIQQYRFGDEFSYTIEIEEEAKECYLPKLIIQPLVENACVHGVESISNKKCIHIQITLVANELVLIVNDNGGGIPTDRLEKLQLMLRGENKLDSSVGLYNVYERLRLNYNDKFFFSINSEIRKGTTCMIKIPAKFPFNEL